MFNLNNLTAAEIVTVYNSVEAKPVKKFRNKDVAVERTIAALKTHGLELRADHDEDAIEDFGFAVLHPAPADGRSARRTHSDEMVITVLTEGNPKRKNSKSAKRFALYTDGITVAEYKIAVGESSRALADIRWDEDHGYIEVK